MSVLLPNEDHSITLDEAKTITKRYRDSSSFGGRNGGFFGADTLRRILDQTYCVGIRYYYGLDQDNAQVLVLVGATEDGDDQYNEELAEVSVPCPSICDNNSPLKIDS